jgi:hypothetical protein
MKKIIITILLLYSFCIFKANACGLNKNIIVNIKKTKYFEGPDNNCIGLDLIFPKVVDQFNTVNVTLKSNISDNYKSIMFLKTEEYDNDNLFSRFCLSKAAISNANIILYYNTEYVVNGHAVKSFCGYWKVIDDLNEFLKSKNNPTTSAD